MKCPACGRPQRYREGLRCLRCGYLFAVDPKRYPGLSDNKLKVLLEKVTGHGLYYVTDDQLYAALVQRSWLSRSVRVILGLLGTLALAIAAILLWAVSYAGGIVVGLIGGAILAFAVHGRTGAVPRADFDAAFERYASRHGPVEKRLARPSLHTPPPAWPEPDIYDYGAEAIVIVNRDLLVDLLVFNNFHAEGRCLVISQTGYPEYVSARAKRLLEERSETPVFLLHDALLSGPAMKVTIRRSPPLPLRGRTVIDLGIGPQEIERMPRLRRLRSAADSDRVPLDFIPYGILASGLAMALQTREPLIHQLEKPSDEPSSFG